MLYNYHMRLTAHGRKFHDPWGNKWGNREGSVIRFQWLVGKTSLSREIMNGEANVHRCAGFIDRTSVYESSGSRFIRGAKRSVERLRK